MFFISYPISEKIQWKGQGIFYLFCSKNKLIKYKSPLVHCDWLPVLPDWTIYKFENEEIIKWKRMQSEMEFPNGMRIMAK